MSAQSNREDAVLASARSRPRRTERAFVIQFDPIEGVRSRLRGRVEVVASGEATHFRSLRELLGFMLGTLRRHVRLSDQETYGDEKAADPGSAVAHRRRRNRSVHSQI
jgi:hypothetical protein